MQSWFGYCFLITLTCSDWCTGVKLPYKLKDKKKRNEKLNANWATLWKYLNMSRSLLLASNCTWSWSPNSLDSLLIRVLMNTNTWLCSTLTSDHWSPPQPRGLRSHSVAAVGFKRNRAHMDKYRVVLNIQNMQAHNFWMRRVGVYSTLLFPFSLPAA